MVVSRFTPNQTFDLINTDMTGASGSYRAISAPKNLIYAIRIDGLFAAIRVRSELCQPKTYRPMAETMPDLNGSATWRTSRAPWSASGIRII